VLQITETGKWVQRLIVCSNLYYRMRPVLIWLFLAWVTTAAIDWPFQHKLTYCKMMAKSRLYREERLDRFCALKVQLHDGEVLFTFYNFLIFFISDERLKLFVLVTCWSGFSLTLVKIIESIDGGPLRPVDGGLIDKIPSPYDKLGVKKAE